MDLRRERKKQNRIVGMTVTVSAVLFAAAAALVILVFSKADIHSDYSDIGGLDSRAEAALTGLEGISGLLNEEDEFSFEINGEIVFKNCKSEGKILLKNPLKNRYLMRAEILIDDKVFLATGNIAPGQIIKEAKPDIKISAGKYKATAIISAIDPNTGKELDSVEQNISVAIKE